MLRESESIKQDWPPIGQPRETSPELWRCFVVLFFPLWSRQDVIIFHSDLIALTIVQRTEFIIARRCVKASFKFVSHRQLTAGEMAYVAQRQVLCASMDREHFDGIARPNISVGLTM